MRRDEIDKDGSTSSEFNVEKNNENEMVTVNNNCVNIDYSNANLNEINDDNNNVQSKNDKASNDKKHLKLEESKSKSLESHADEGNSNLNKFIYDRNVDDLNDDDDDALATTSSNYLDNVSSHCEMSSSLEESPSSSTSHASAAQYKPTRDNSRNHRQAVRENFSLWIGVTSCVWACLVLLMKNYA